eukprot:TRINITY_DN20392_c0_g1_i1.p1 TRINITY_DN20392_c0_g1~~TRINITY_DN20392_c0_g1_i1.p1  ORF type:complete len:376 (+),score=100.24 TRINITY_DN20392_c0_g1_i1:103-1128(+)
MRRTTARLGQVLVQPLGYQGEPAKEADGWRKAGRAQAGGQYGTRAAPVTGRPFLYHGPEDLPYWHHVADIWRPKQQPTAAVSGHAQALPSLEGPFPISAPLIACRPLLQNIILHRNSQEGPQNALARWEAAKTGFGAGIFDAPCMHRVGYFVLDVLAEHREYDSGAQVYEELHGTLGFPFDAGHAEKMIWLCYCAEQHAACAQYFAAAEAAKATGLLKTAAWATVMACHGRNLEGARALELWDQWIYLERPVSSFPPALLAEIVMGCLSESEVAGAKKVLRHFNDFYLEAVWGYCRATGMENDAMIYYVEWLFKSRRHVLFDPMSNTHLLQYAYRRITAQS